MKYERKCDCGESFVAYNWLHCLEQRGQVGTNWSCENLTRVAVPIVIARVMLTLEAGGRMQESLRWWVCFFFSYGRMMGKLVGAWLSEQEGKFLLSGGGFCWGGVVCV